MHSMTRRRALMAAFGCALAALHASCAEDSTVGGPTVEDTADAAEDAPVEAGDVGGEVRAEQDAGPAEDAGCAAPACECAKTEDCAAEEDGDLCNGTLVCDVGSGKCVLDAGTVVHCDPDADTACRKAVCRAETGLCEAELAPEGKACDDGDGCTEQDACKTGQCAGAKNTCECQTSADCPVEADLCKGSRYCDKSDPSHQVCKHTPNSEVKCPPGGDGVCTANLCVPATGKCEVGPMQDGSECDLDFTPCTPDTCKAGKCMPGELSPKGSGGTSCACTKNADCKVHDSADRCLPVHYCNKAIHVCTPNPASALECPDGQDTACSRARCEPATGKCVMKELSDGAQCDDGLACSAGDACKEGACTSKTYACACKKTADCKPLEDGDECTGTLYCDKVTGQCAVNPGTVAKCTGDAPACRRLECRKDKGCVPVADDSLDGKPCEADGSWCTAVDRCDGGECKPATNRCPCEKDGDCAAKEGPGLCGGKLYCDKGTGTCAVNPATRKQCPEGDQECAPLRCDPADGACKPTPRKDGQACDKDGFPCTTDACAGGKCVTKANECLCWEDADCALASKGKLCAGSWYCDKAAGPPACKPTPNSAVSCPEDDPKGCLGSRCDPGTGTCKAVPIHAGMACQDGDACTTGDRCAAGKCVGLAAEVTVLCDDGNLCSTDACDHKNGCVHLPNVATCTDGDPCTHGDRCKSRKCVPGKTPKCDDGQLCTDDACNPGTGACQHAANHAPCDDGKLCTGPDACKGGACLPGPATKCDDGDACTEDSCDPATGCRHRVKDPKCGLIIALPYRHSFECAEHAGGNKFFVLDNAGAAGGGAAWKVREKPYTGAGGKGCAIFFLDAEDSLCTSGRDHEYGRWMTGWFDATKVGHDKRLVLRARRWGSAPTSYASLAVWSSVDGLSWWRHPLRATGHGGWRRLEAELGTRAGTLFRVRISAEIYSCSGAMSPEDSGSTSIGDPGGGASSSPGGDPLGIAIDDLEVLAIDKCAKDADCADMSGCTAGTCDAASGACDRHPKDCYDDNPCTDDDCEVATGKCTHAPAPARPCQDGDPCTGEGACKAGKCVAAGCDDHNPCTVDHCEPGLGCFFYAAKDGTACSDTNACTSADACHKAECTGTAGTCGVAARWTFPCGDKQWQTTIQPAAGKLGWAVDASPSNPGFLSPSCSLNFDDGESIRCPAGSGGPHEAVAISPAVKLPPGVAAGLSFYSRGGYSSLPTLVDARVEVSADGFQTIAASSAVPPSNAWRRHTLDLGKLAGGTVRVRMRIRVSACPTEALPVPWYGWFVDDLTVRVGSSASCSSDQDCDDKNPCTTNSCAAGKCVLADNHAPCEDGNKCTTDDRCAGGSCSAGRAVVCPAGKVCTDATCDPLLGCGHRPSLAGRYCDDPSKPCEGAGVCDGKGACAGRPRCPDDPYGCIKVSCDPAMGSCTSAPLQDGAPCRDGDPCTQGDTCAHGVCRGKPASCTARADVLSCDPKSVAIDPAAPEPFPGWHLDGTPAAPGARSKPCSLNINNGQELFCAFGKTSIHGLAAATTTLDLTAAKEAVLQFWSWSDVPTDEYSSSGPDQVVELSTDGFKTVAQSVRVVTPLEHRGSWQQLHFRLDWGLLGRKVRVRWRFELPTCSGEPPTGWFVDDVRLVLDSPASCAKDSACDDGNACTTDHCAQSRCIHQALDQGPCEDGSPCTRSDRCKGGWCEASRGCDDENPCTADICRPDKGCLHEPSGKGRTCYRAEVCVQTAGTCDGGGQCVRPPKCDDGNACTVDSCDPGTGQCAHAPAKDSAVCDDGDLCTSPDTCKAGACTTAPGPCKLLLRERFDKDTPPGWKLTTPPGPGNRVAWRIDGTAWPPGFRSPPASLNFNGADGTYACGPLDTALFGVAELPELDLAGAKRATLTLYSFFDHRTGVLNDRRYLELSTDGWKTVASSIRLPNRYSDRRRWRRVEHRLDDFAGKKLRLRFRIDSGTCPYEPSYTGWFIDDVTVVADGATACSTAQGCDDGNTCTSDLCKAGQCVHARLGSGACEDGDVCTLATSCMEGVCVSDGKMKDCNLGQPCRVYRCHPVQGCRSSNAPDNTLCTDGDKCTVDPGSCIGGKCISRPRVPDFDLPCITQTCDAVTGKLSSKPTPEGTTCTSLDACRAGICSSYECNYGGKPTPCTWSVPAGSECADSGDWAFASGTAGGPGWHLAERTAPPFAAVGKCALVFNDPVSGAYACPAGESRVWGTATLKTPLDLTKAKVATLTWFGLPDIEADYARDKRGVEISTDGWKTVARTVDLDAGYGAPSSRWTRQALPLNDYVGHRVWVRFRFDSVNCYANAHSGWWIDDVRAVVDGGPSCTKDADCKAPHPCLSGVCTAAAQCSTTFNPAPCDDGDPCTTPDKCAFGQCRSGPPCNDHNPCTSDACVGGKACKFTPRADDSTCNDGDPCTLSGPYCKAGKCAAPSRCDDDNPCTADTCHNGSCGHAPATDGAKCEDGEVCTVGESCRGGLCEPAGDVCHYTDAAIGADCDATGWTMKQLSGPAGAAEKWAFDSTPSLPAPKQGKCTLNFNNGIHYANQLGSITSAAISPAIEVPAAGHHDLVFWDYNGMDPSAADLRFVDIGTDPAFGYGSFTSTRLDYLSGRFRWREQVMPLNKWRGKKIQVRFRVFVSSTSGNFGPGWFVDGLRLRKGIPRACSGTPGKPGNADCDDQDSCTEDICAALGNCTHRPIIIGACDKGLKLPYANAFDCDSNAAADFHDQGGIPWKWAVDAVPNFRNGYHSPECSLNLNQPGTRPMECPPGAKSIDHWVSTPRLTPSQKPPGISHQGIDACFPA